MVETLAAAFCNAAAQQEELQGTIEIQLLRSVVDKLTVNAQAHKEQLEKLADILQILQRFEPLDLDLLERRYLEGLYEECNDLRVIRDPREQLGGRSRPRLQRVWVQLQTQTAPTLEQTLTRLKLPAQKQRDAERLCRAAAQSGDQRAERGKGESGEQIDTVRALKQFSVIELAALAKQLGVAVKHLAASLENLTPVEALHAMRQIVVVGAPGSGKSMLTQRLAALLAAAGSGDPEILSDLSDHERDDLQDLLTKLGRRLLPVRIVLNRWTPASANGPCANDLIDECVRVVGRSGDLPALKTHLMKRLKRGEATLLVLLDGLDEVTDRTRRERQLAALEDFHRHYGDVPMIVTCRVLPYQAWRRQGDILSLPDAQLDCLIDAAIAQFIDRWYDELKRTGVYEDHALAEQARQRLRTAVSDTQRANYEELHKMAGFPLLLTMMAHVNYRKALPESRAALYNDFVEQLLYKWEEYRLGGGREHAAQPTAGCSQRRYGRFQAGATPPCL